MKYSTLFILIFAVAFYSTGQTNAVLPTTKVIPAHKAKAKKRWSFLDRVCLLSQITCPQFTVIADSASTRPRNLSIGFLSPGDTLSLKEETRIKKDNLFMNVLYPFAIYDSLQLFNTLTIFHCADSSNCKPLTYDLKKLKLTKLKVDQKLKNVLSVLALKRGCKIDTAANHKLRINVVLTVDSASCWQSYAYMHSYAMKVAFVIYDYVLPKSKEKEYYSIQFYYTEPDGKEIEAFQFFFEHPIFKQMYELCGAQTTQGENYEIAGRHPIVDTSSSTNGQDKTHVFKSDEMPLYKTVAPVVLKKITNKEEYQLLKDTLEWFFKERIFFRAIIGPPDVVINSSDLPVKVFIPSVSVKKELETFEENGLNVLALVYTKLLRSYQQFKTISLTAQLTDGNESEQFTTVYYLQPTEDIKEEKRIIVYCRKKKKWRYVTVPKPEYQYE